MSKIEWTNETWNPVTGCTKVSAGCKHCYAERMAKRLAGRHGYPAAPDSFRVTQHPDRLTQPLHFRRPRMIFVCSMGDLFHRDVPDKFIDQVFAIMALCPQHTFQVLTKRPERMAEYLNWYEFTAERAIEGRVDRVDMWGHAMGEFDGKPGHTRFIFNPLPNVWLGTSVEDQPAADERVPHLLRCPAAVRFLSCEPLLGAVDLQRHHWTATYAHWLSWVIIGCESTSGGRVGRLPEGTEEGYWTAARSIIDQCDAAGVPVFHKQAPLNGKVSHEPAEWPEDTRRRDWPETKR